MSDAETQGMPVWKGCLAFFYHAAKATRRRRRMEEKMKINILKDTMAEMPYTEVEKLAQKGAVVLFPVGIIEEHGPHLPLGTDIYLAYEQALTRQFPGTFGFRKETIITCICELLESLDRFGFRKVVFFNDHGDGLHIGACLEAIRQANAKLSLRAYWPEYADQMEEHGFSGEEEYLLPLTPVSFDEMFACEKMPRDEFDVHAGAFETAVMREICPEFVREGVLADLEPIFLKGEEIGRWCMGEAEDKHLIPDGYVGDPAGSVYVKSRLRAVDELIAKDIRNLVQTCCAQKTCAEMEKK